MVKQYPFTAICESPDSNRPGAALVKLLNSACLQATGHALPHLEGLDMQPTLREVGQAPFADAPHRERVWLYAPGRDAEHWDEFYREGIIAIGWNELGDLSKFQDLEELTDKIREV